jgi:hypothetical protein
MTNILAYYDWVSRKEKKNFIALFSKIDMQPMKLKCTLLHDRSGKIS